MCYYIATTILAEELAVPHSRSAVGPCVGLTHPPSPVAIPAAYPAKTCTLVPGTSSAQQHSKLGFSKCRRITQEGTRSGWVFYNISQNRILVLKCHTYSEYAFFESFKVEDETINLEDSSVFLKTSILFQSAVCLFCQSLHLLQKNLDH